MSFICCQLTIADRHVTLCFVVFLGWTVNAEDRPTFVYLVNEFDRMADEPQRYLRVQVCASDLNS